MRVLVCGGREYGDADRVYRVLDALEVERGRIGVVIHGGAPGADWLADCWGVDRGKGRERYTADWTRGPRGGPERNARMIREGRPDLVVAFPGGRGTADMVRRARAAGVEVVEVEG